MLKGREAQKKSANVDDGNLLVFSFPIYALLDLGSTFSIVTPFVGNQFDLFPENLHEPFLVSTPIGNIFKAQGVCTEVYGIVVSPFEIKLGVIKFKS